MRSAAPSRWEHQSTLIRGWRWLAAFVAFGLSGACSVYTTDGLDATTGITTGGNSTSGSSHGGAPGGNASNTGGVLAPGTSSEGGQGGEGGERDGSQPTAGTVGAVGAAGAPSTGGAGGGAGPDGMAGSAGAGGTVTDSGGLLDDFEDQNLVIEQTDRRGGVWYTFTDGTTGTIAPTPLVCSPNSGAPDALGDFAMHITATGFSSTGTVGSGLGVDFRDQEQVYNGSRFSGIRFWAKVGAGKNTKHRMQIADATTDQAGGRCNPAPAAPNGEKCDAHFGIDETFTTSWTQYTVRFDQLTQPSWGLQADTLDSAALYGLQITAAPNSAVNLWLDQIEFF